MPVSRVRSEEHGRRSGGRVSSYSLRPRRPPPGRLPGGSRRRSAAAVLGRASRPGARTSVWEGFFVAPLPPRGSRSGRQTKVPVAATGGGGAGAPAAGGPAASSPSLPWPGLLVLVGEAEQGTLGRRAQTSSTPEVGALFFVGGSSGPGRAAGQMATGLSRRSQRGLGLPGPPPPAARSRSRPSRAAPGALRPRPAGLRAGCPRCPAPAPTCGPRARAGRGRAVWDRAVAA